MQQKYLLATILPAIALIAIMPTAFASNGVGAIHINEANWCSMVDPSNAPYTTLTGSLKDVLTPSGNENILCKATIPGYNGPAVSFDNSNTGVLCSSAYGAEQSTDWNEQVSANGKVTFTCHISNVVQPTG